MSVEMIVTVPDASMRIVASFYPTIDNDIAWTSTKIQVFMFNGVKFIYIYMFTNMSPTFWEVSETAKWQVKFALNLCAKFQKFCS